MTRISLFLTPTLLGLALAPTFALAQMPPPEHGAAASAPLFVQELPVGTVSVRIARPSMAEALADVEVTGRWITTDGKQKSAVTKTGSDGRAVFSDIPVGSSFQASATVEGEEVATERFAVPGEGGTRLLLIVGAQAAEALADMTGQQLPPGHPTQPKKLPVRAGKVEARDGVDPATLELRVLGTDGKPMPNLKVDLVHPKHGANGVDLQHAMTDALGTARFANLQTGEDARYVATLDHDGMRLATDIFTLEAKRGSAGEIRLPGRTNSLAVLRISEISRTLVELREKAIGVLQNLIIENTSDQIFDPGPQGLLIPLPDGFSGAEKLQGGADFEVKEGRGAILQTTIPPTQSATDAPQVRIGYLLARNPSSEFELVQPMPLGMQGGIVMVPGEFPLTVSAPGIRARPAERDDNGSELRMYDLDAVAPGQALRLTVQGLPTREKTGQWIAGILTGLVVIGGVFAIRRPRRALGTKNKAR